MKIICISDTHGQHVSKKLTEQIWTSKADMLLFAGDFQLNSFDFADSFVNWLSVVPIEHKVAIAGNHDNNDYCLKRKGREKGIHVLRNEAVTIEGLTIFGSPNTLPFLNWYHMKTEKQLEEVYASIPDRTTILLTHVPPFHMMDLTVNPHTAERGTHIGSISLRERIDELEELKACVFGHVHEKAGYQIEDGVQYVNASVLDGKYRLKNEPIIIEV